MTSERMRRRLDAFLDEADEAATRGEWSAVAEKARAVLALEAENGDALGFLKMAEVNLDTPATTSTPMTEGWAAAIAPAPQPESFAAGRYHVRRFLGEGGKKRVFLAHDALLDRDVAFALIKTDGLDDVGRERITREAQAMGRMGSHPNLVSVYDLGEEGGAPYIVTELLAGGDLEGELGRAGGPLEPSRALAIAAGVARGLAFAHERGIVHRDLKPGNVWLTENGTPKIGDFGLAVSEGRSRLTQHGMMVGTFAYMAPEQALGAEATPRSDLYSLGCMLYELVTGRPPFEGDTPTAVISQHLNTTPVAPSWHTERCPPALEDLILELLAKEPASRLGSATEVLAVIERIDPGERSRSHSEPGVNPLDRLATGVFVGRERELERLRSALDNALAGRGSLVMLVGEPGIGKTRTTQELETYARMRGAKVLWGRAAETAGAPPYWTWLQVARSYREQTPDDEERRAQYQPYAVDLQRIFPALRTLFPNLPEPPDADSETGAFRLYDALASFLRSVAVETPLMVVLDDLHWADRASLSALTHLSRELGRSRLLVLGTYRDTDLDRRHPLAHALAEMNREDMFTRIPLRGLSLTETEDYLARTADAIPTPALVRRVYEETEGNPFFLSEVVNLMTQEGTLGASVSDVRIPEGVKEALGRRLDRLSGEANSLLTTLSVVGRDFDHALVLELSGHDDNTTLGLLEEALRARVIEETAPGRYRFMHALMQETLLGELSAARRVLLHGQIAEVLEHLYPENRDHLAAMAEHYRESALLNREHAQKAMRFLKRAGDVAAAGFAWDEAARLYQRCLLLIRTPTDQQGTDEGPLWLDLAMAQFGSGELTPAWAAFDQAVRLMSDRPGALASAAIELAIVLGTPFMYSHVAIWQQLADGLSGTPSLEACQADAVLAVTDLGPNGAVAQQRAAATFAALSLEDPRIPFLIAWRENQLLAQDGDYAAILTRSAELRPLATAAGALRRWAAQAFTMARHAGNLELAAQLAREAADAHREAGNLVQAELFEVDLTRVSSRRNVSPPSLGDPEGDHTAPWWRLLRAETYLEAGDFAAAETTLPPRDQAVFGNTALLNRLLGLRCRILLGSSQTARARTAFEEFWGDGRSEPEQFLTAIASFDDALCTLGQPALLEQIAEALKRFRQLRSFLIGTGPDYLRGAIALELERVDEAEQHFRTGYEWASRPDVRFEVDAGRCLQGLAEVAERRARHLEAMEHLDAAGALFARHGAKLYLDQVIAKKSVLGA